MKQMYKRVILLINFFLILTIIKAQSFHWAKSIGGGNREESNSIITDVIGNIYISGYFEGTADFDPGAGTYNLSSIGDLDIFILKLDASGNFLWAKSFGGTKYDESLSMFVDTFGNIYTTGYFHGTVDFDPGNGVVIMTSTSTSLFPDIFIHKLDAFGNFVWVKSFGSSGYDSGTCITGDKFGNIYITGSYSNTVDFDSGVGIYNHTAAGGIDIFILKIDTLGNFIWAKSLGGNTGDAGISLCTDTLGNVHSTGYFSGTADFDPGIGVYNLTSLGSNIDIFISKLDSFGNFIFAKSLTGITNLELPRSISLDLSGNIYTTGNFGGLVDFDSGIGTYNLNSIGGRDIYVHKMDGIGNFLWAKSFGSTGEDFVSDIKVDAIGNIYTIGFFSNTTDFDPGAGSVITHSIGSSDIFIQKLDAFGNFLWVNSYGSTVKDCGYSISIDVVGNIYTTGSFQNIVDFDPGAGTTNVISAGSSDVFVHKMSQSIGFIDFNNGIKVIAHPNPSSGIVFIKFDKMIDDELELKLTNIQGKVVYSKRSISTNDISVELPEIKGIYILTIKTQKTLSAIKLVKE